MTMRVSRRARLVLVVVTVTVSAAAVAILLSVQSGRPVQPTGKETHQLAGDFTLWGSAPVADPCQPRTEAPDIHAGAPVDVRNEGGATVATASLSKGQPDPTHRGCVYHFTVPRLPVAGSYTFQVGERLGLTYPHNEVAQAGWRVTLNLGLPAPTPAATS
jgi:hypothetical protein